MKAYPLEIHPNYWHGGQRDTDKILRCLECNHRMSLEPEPECANCGQEFQLLIAEKDE